MHSFRKTVVPFTPRLHAEAGQATLIAVLPAETDLHTGGLALCLAYRLAQLRQRVLLIDLDDSNDVAMICGFRDLLAQADQQGLTSNSCIATNRPFSPHIGFNFASLAVMPAGLTSAAASERLRELCERAHGITTISASSLLMLRHQYDFILLDAPPMFTPYRLQNLLADFAMWKADAVLVPYRPKDSRCQQRMMECGQFVRSARIVHANLAPCDIWLLPVEAHNDPTLLVRSQAHFAPNPAMKLHYLPYQDLRQKLTPLYQPSIQMHTRIAHVRGVAQLLEDTAQKCLSFRGVPPPRRDLC